MFWGTTWKGNFVMRFYRPILFPLLAVIALSLACSLPTAPGTSTPTTAAPTDPAELPTNTPTLAPVKTATPAQQPTQGPAPVSEITFYLVALEDQGQSGIPIGCGDSLVEVTQPVDPTTQPARAALERLFSFKTQYVGESGLYTALYQSNLQVDSVAIDADGTAHVALSGQPRLGGTCDVPRFQGQIEQTIQAAPGVKVVEVTINGRPIEEVLSSQ